MNLVPTSWTFFNSKFLNPWRSPYLENTVHGTYCPKIWIWRNAESHALLNLVLWGHFEKRMHGAPMRPQLSSDKFIEHLSEAKIWQCNDISTQQFDYVDKKMIWQNKMNLWIRHCFLCWQQSPCFISVNLDGSQLFVLGGFWTSFKISLKMQLFGSGAFVSAMQLRDTSTLVWCMLEVKEHTSWQWIPINN